VILGRLQKIDEAVKAFDATSRLTGNGDSPEQIAKLIFCPVEAIRLLLTLRETFEQDLGRVRRFFLAISLGAPDKKLAADFGLPISTITAVRRDWEKLNLPAKAKQ